MEPLPGPTRRDLLRGAGGALALAALGCPSETPSSPPAGSPGPLASATGATPERWCQSVCPYCGVGCGVEIGVAAGSVVAVRGMADHPVNRGELCLLGRTLPRILQHEERLVRPMRRVEGALRPCSWDEAIGAVAGKIREVVDRHGPDAFAMYVSASEHLEEYYAYSKLVKGCLGTNNLESSARLCWASGVTGIVQAFGADAPPCAYDDLEQARLLVLAGYNPANSKPVLFRRLALARRASGAKLIVIDPRRTETAQAADLHLKLRPGSDVALHNAIAHVLFAEGLVREEEARALCENLDALREHVAEATPARAAEVTGLPEAQIVQAARWIGQAEAALFLWGQGLNQSSIGTRKVSSFLNLAFITGNVGKPGAGPLAVTGQSSAMALREVGALPHLLPGFRLAGDEAARAQVAAHWKLDPARLSPRPGRTIPDILTGLEQGQVKVLWVIHSNPAATFPDSAWARAALARAEMLIVQDCYHPTETSELAHVLLPAAQWSEKAGTVVNSERGLNLVEAAVRPPGEARTDLEIVVAVAQALGYGEQLPSADPQALFEEYKPLTKGRPCDITGVTWERLKRDKGIQWPVPAADHPGTKRRFLDRRFPKGKVALGLHAHAEPAETPDAEFPLLLITGVVAPHFHSRTRTGKVPELSAGSPEPFVEVHPRDVEAAGLAAGSLVRVRSRRGAVQARLRPSETVQPGVVFVPYHFGALAGPERAVNAITARNFDEKAKQPEYKAAAVRLEQV